jgi:hypothetical protein
MQSTSLTPTARTYQVCATQTQLRIAVGRCLERQQRSGTYPIGHVFRREESSMHCSGLPHAESMFSLAYYRSNIEECLDVLELSARDTWEGASRSQFCSSGISPSSLLLHWFVPRNIPVEEGNTGASIGRLRRR